MCGIQIVLRLPRTLSREVKVLPSTADVARHAGSVWPVFTADRPSHVAIDWDLGADFLPRCDH